MNAIDVTKPGRDTECLALSGPVRWHVENQTPVHGYRTVVFS